MYDFWSALIQIEQDYSPSNDIIMPNIPTRLKPEEYKQLLIDVAIAISPKIIESFNDRLIDSGDDYNSELVAARVALYARDITDAVETILLDHSGKDLKGWGRE